MGDVVTETTAMAAVLSCQLHAVDKHNKALGGCVKLTRGALELLQRDLLSVETESFSTGFASRSTVGVMLAANKIDNMVIGGPAFVSGKLHKGDEILKVDGADCSSVEDLRKGLKGSDLPGSCVVLTVKKLRSGNIEDVPLVRVASEVIADRRRLFELFTSLKDRTLLAKDSQAHNIIDDAINLWSKTVLADMMHDQIIEKNVKELQMECRAMLEELSSQLPKLQVQYQENSTVVEVRQDLVKVSQELEQCKNDFQVQSNCVVRLEQQLASAKEELRESKDDNAKVMGNKTAEVHELESALDRMKGEFKGYEELHRQQSVSLHAEIDELRKQMAAESTRAAALQAATIESSVAAEKANLRAEGCDVKIQELLRKISDLASELHNTKVALDQDESELKKDRELLIKDKQELMMKNGRIDELERHLAAANAELKASHEQSAAQINIIAAKEKEFEELSHTINITVSDLKRELKDAQTAVAKGSTSACHLEAEVEKLKVANNIQTNVLGELESNAQAREKVIQDLNGRIFQLQGEIERLESNLTKKQIETNGLNSTLSDLASKCKDLQGALSQVSKDLDAANQSTQDLESKRAGLEKAKTKLEAAVYEGGKQLQAKDREAIECKQQLKVALDEIEALKKQLKGRASHDAAVESEQSDLRRQLAALSLDRDNLAQAAAQLAEARADFETQNTHSPSKQLGLRGAQDDNSHLQNEIQRLGKNLGDAQAEIENLRLNLYNLQEKSNQKQQAQRAAPMPPTLAIFSETSLEKCCKLVGLIQKRVDENHLADHDIVTTVSSEATTVGISFTEKSGKIVVYEVLVSGPAFRSKKIAKGDEILSINGESNLQGDAIFEALKGSNVPGSKVTLMVKKANSALVEEVVLYRMSTFEIADKRKMFDIWTKIVDSSRKSRDDTSAKLAQDGLELWTQMELEQIMQDERCEANVAAMQRDCNAWLTELIALLGSLDMSSRSLVSAPEGQIAELKQHILMLEKTMAELHSMRSEQDTQLKTKEQLSAKLQLELDDLKGEMHSVAQNAKKQADEVSKLRTLSDDLQRRLTESGEELARLKESSHGKNMECRDISEKLSHFDGQCKSLKNSNADLKVRVAELEQQLHDKASKLAVLQKPQRATPPSSEHSDTLQRAIHLCQQTKEYVNSDLLVGHGTSSKQDSNMTTVGVSFDEKTCIVTGVMVCGSAFNSKKVQKGDTIVAVDGQKVSGNQISCMLIGSDKPGSVVEVTLKKPSGTSEVVKLQRMATSMIADKKKLFEILTKIVDRCKRDKDAEMIKHLEEAIELWTQMMLEEHDQDMKSEANVAKMQQSCDEWLEELLILLSNGEVALWTDEGTIKTARNPQSVRTLFASEAGELDNLRSQLAVARERESIQGAEIASKDAELFELKANLNALAQQLSDAKRNNNELSQEPVREQLLALRAELDEVNSSLLTATNDVTTLNRHKSKLQEELSLLQKEVEKKNGTIDELKKCISDLDTWVNMSKSELDLVRSTFVRCRQLIAQTRARVAENPMPEVEVVTHCDKEPTTVGISFEESYGKMTIINLMVGGPAFNSKQITKGDEVLAIDGMRDLRGHQISDALKGSNIAGTKVTLTIKKRQTGEIEDVPLARVLTASIADKRKLFDIFTKMANRANQDQDLDLQRLVEEGLQLWSAMELEERRRESKFRRNFRQMQSDSDSWLSDCYSLLNGVDGEKAKVDEFTDDLLFEVLEKSEESMANDQRVLMLTNAITTLTTYNF